MGTFQKNTKYTLKRIFIIDVLILVKVHQKQIHISESICKQMPASALKICTNTLTNIVRFVILAGGLTSTSSCFIKNLCSFTAPKIKKPKFPIDFSDGGMTQGLKNYTNIRTCAIYGLWGFQSTVLIFYKSRL